MPDGTIPQAPPAPSTSRRRRVGEHRSEMSVALLVRALEHAADCGHPDCRRCHEILRRLDEPSLWSARVLGEHMERADLLAERAHVLLEALQVRGMDRQRQVRVAIEALRQAAQGEYVTESKYTVTQRRGFARESLHFSRSEMCEFSARIGVAPTTVYNWRNAYLNEPSAPLHAAPLDPTTVGTAPPTVGPPPGPSTVASMALVHPQVAAPQAPTPAPIVEPGPRVDAGAQGREALLQISHRSLGAIDAALALAKRATETP